MIVYIVYIASKYISSENHIQFLILIPNLITKTRNFDNMVDFFKAIGYHSSIKIYLIN